MKKTVSNQNKAVKHETGRTFIASRAAGDKMEELNGNDVFSLVRDQKGQLFTRIMRYELKRKDGTWRNLPFSIFANPRKMRKLGWCELPQSQTRVRYDITPVTREQAVKWLVKEHIPEEFQADILTALHELKSKPIYRGPSMTTKAGFSHIKFYKIKSGYNGMPKNAHITVNTVAPILEGNIVLVELPKKGIKFLSRIYKASKSKWVLRKNEDPYMEIPCHANIYRVESYSVYEKGYEPWGEEKIA